MRKRDLGILLLAAFAILVCLQVCDCPQESGDGFRFAITKSAAVGSVGWEVAIVLLLL